MGVTDCSEGDGSHAGCYLDEATLSHLIERAFDEARSNLFQPHLKQAPYVPAGSSEVLSARGGGGSGWHLKHM